MASPSVYYPNNTAIARIRGLKTPEGVYLDNAVVTLRSLVDEATGAAVAGVSLPIQMSFVAGTNGNYEGEVTHALEVDIGKRYLATVRAVLPGGQQGEWEEIVTIRKRRG